ncbi:MAG: molecular chaperone [Anaerolineae bacterium]
MNIDLAIRRAQVYGFLSEAFLYPAEENWTEDIALMAGILADLDFCQVDLSLQPVALPDLQATYRRAFGVTGSLCYETEYGLPHEFRQSQEMADLSGFYHAFGFTIGGPIRERPDHVAVELEFMHVLALKEAYAADRGVAEQVEVCVEAQRKFLQEHLGRWIGLFAQSLALNAGDGVYANLVRFAADFIKADAARLGVQLPPPRIGEVKHTPFDPDFSCATCLATEL